MKAQKDKCPPSSEHAPLIERPGDEPDEACPPPSSPSPREDEALTEETSISSLSGSDADYKPPPSSSSSSEDEMLTQRSQSSSHSAPERHHSNSSSSKSETGEAKDQKAKGKSVQTGTQSKGKTKLQDGYKLLVLWDMISESTVSIIVRRIRLSKWPRLGNCCL